MKSIKILDSLIKYKGRCTEEPNLLSCKDCPIFLLEQNSCGSDEESLKLAIQLKKEIEEQNAKLKWLKNLK